jgi:hypothetical protein
VRLLNREIVEKRREADLKRQKMKQTREFIEGNAVLCGKKKALRMTGSGRRIS